jgi:uncharacterized membrane protein YraQ (UPF0718 family)
MKKLSIGKILIWGSILAYLVGVILSVAAWFIHRQIDNDLAWNWEIIYGPLITLAFYVDKSKRKIRKKLNNWDVHITALKDSTGKIIIEARIIASMMERVDVLRVS